MRAANHPVPIRRFLIDSALSHPVYAVSCEKKFGRTDGCGNAAAVRKISYARARVARTNLMLSTR